MNEHTPPPLTYLVHPRDNGKIGDNWHLCLLDFGADGQFSITTDRVHASESVFGEPEDDVRLWCAASALLATVEDLLRHYAMGHENNPEIKRARAVIALAKEGRQ